MYPTIGRIVHYTLSPTDAAQINRRRTSSESIADRVNVDKWPLGAQAHIGAEAQAGDVLPMIITSIFSQEIVTGQVFLNGNDTLFKLNAEQGDEPGQWNWPPRV